MDIDIWLFSCVCLLSCHSGRGSMVEGSALDVHAQALRHVP
jgi:hypothetical protein